jgi:hypothetical protein
LLHIHEFFELIFCVADANGELGAKGARVLADFLQTQTECLVLLHAATNEFGDEGIPILLEPFSACRNVLEELSLEMNEIEEEGTKALISAFFPKLRVLNLRDNDDMNQKHIRAKYGDRVSFGEDAIDEDEDGGDDDDELNDLVAQMAVASL